MAPGTLPTLPAVRNDLPLGSAGSFSGRGLHLGKTWRERCSWRCAAIGLILLCATLAALLAYFAGEFGEAPGGGDKNQDIVMIMVIVTVITIIILITIIVIISCF